MTRWTQEQIDAYEQKRGWDKPGTLSGNSAFEQGRRMAREPVEAEADVLKHCLEFLRLHPKVAWAVRMNTGAWKHEESGRYVKFGFRGCADIIGQMKTGEFLAFEVKRQGEKPSEDQQAFLLQVGQNNGVAGWGGLKELQEILEEV